MSRLSLLGITSLLIASLSACGSSDDASNNADATVEAIASANVSDIAKYNRDMSKKGCEILTADLVAQQFAVPVAELKQFKIAGCRYSWSNDSETLEAALSMIQAHNSQVNAERWFGNATKSKTAEEMASEMERIAGQLDKQEKLDTDTKISAAKSLLKSLGSKAVNFEDIAGIGDEARVNDEGSIYVRIDNLTFIVSAYKGAKQPPIDLKGVALADMAKAASQASRQWASETAGQRKVDGAKLAKAIAEAV